MDTVINYKKIALFLILSFGISWLVALLIYILEIDISTTKGTILIAGPYMFGPAIATFIIQKFIYKEGFKKYGWSFDPKKWKTYLKIPLIFISLMLATFLVIYVLGNVFHFDVFGLVDFSQDNFDEKMQGIIESKGVTDISFPELPSKLMFIGFLLQGTIIGGLINLPVMFGEEFGWRGLLLHETKAMGFLKSAIFIGLFWGIWHFPIIVMGHNYPNYPYIGMAMMCVFTFFLSPIFTYVRMKTKSILGACLLHGMINGTAILFLIYIANGNELFNSIAGVAGAIASSLIIAGIYYFDKPFITKFNNQNYDKI